MLRNYLLSILSVPLSDSKLTAILSQRDLNSCIASLEEWLVKVQQLHPSFQYEIIPPNGHVGWLILEVQSPYEGRVGFRFVDQNSLSSERSISRKALDENVTLGLSLVILVLCADETQAKVMKAIEECWDQTQKLGDDIIMMEPSWVSAIIIEQLKPIVADHKNRNPALTPTSYFSEPDAVASNDIQVRHVQTRYQSLLGAVTDEPGSFPQKWRDLQKESVFGGTILLCTTFLPPVTHSPTAVERFYRSFGATDETCALIRAKTKWEVDVWRKHIKSHQRIDIIDRGQVEEYFSAPEYYQMPLSTDELQEQFSNILKLLAYDNYQICLTAEAVDLSYEIRGTEVRIRTDRRNKGQPRLGRISGVAFNAPHMVDVFEREFWSMYRLTEPEFKDKKYISKWLEGLVAKYKGAVEKFQASPPVFDVFLCHNSADKPAVKHIGEQLIANGIRPWLDEWNLIPGRPWQRALEEQIAKIKSVAVFVGDSGLGPWTSMELEAFLREFVQRGCPVIPIILRSATQVPELPLFLKAMHWVDFRKDEPDPLDQLIWGITGEKPQRARRIRKKRSHRESQS